MGGHFLLPRLVSWLATAVFTCAGASCNTEVVIRIRTQSYYVIGGCHGIAPPTAPPQFDFTHLHRITDDVAVCRTGLVPIQCHIPHTRLWNQIRNLARNGVQSSNSHLARRYRGDAVGNCHGEGVIVGRCAVGDNERGPLGETLRASRDTTL